MELNQYMDHTLLKQNATQEQLAKLCDEAREYHFKTVSINGTWTAFAAERLKGSGVPLGACSTAGKVAEARQAVEDGTTEIDMVLNVGRLLSGDDEYCTKDIAAVVEAAQGHPVKVILECCLLDDDQIVRACKCAEAAGAAFVKTSTGFSTGGATVHDVELMKRTVGDRLKIKAAGGIHTREDALAMIAAGADRIGASASIAICTE